jgi:hypothetical protein
VFYPTYVSHLSHHSGWGHSAEHRWRPGNSRDALPTSKLRSQVRSICAMPDGQSLDTPVAWRSTVAKWKHTTVGRDPGCPVVAFLRPCRALGTSNGLLPLLAVWPRSGQLVRSTLLVLKQVGPFGENALSRSTGHRPQWCYPILQPPPANALWDSVCFAGDADGIRRASFVSIISCPDCLAFQSKHILESSGLGQW